MALLEAILSPSGLLYQFFRLIISASNRLLVLGIHSGGRVLGGHANERLHAAELEQLSIPDTSE